MADKKKPGPVANSKERRREAWLLARQLKTQAEIAVLLDVSEPTVCHWLQEIDAALWQEFVPIAERVKVEQTLALEHIALEARKAWERSQLDAEKVVTDADGKQTRTEEGQCGDPGFLGQIRGALADIRKIWGIDSPEKHELMHTQPQKPISQIVSELISLAGGKAQKKPRPPTRRKKK